MANNEIGTVLPSTKPIIALVVLIGTLWTAGSFWMYTQVHSWHAGTHNQPLRPRVEGPQPSKVPSEIWDSDQAGPKAAVPAPDQVAQLKILEQWILQGTLIVAVGSLALALSLMRRVTSLRRTAKKAAAGAEQRWAETAQRLTETAGTLQSQMAECKRLEEEVRQLRQANANMEQQVEERVQQRTTALTKTYAAMTEELNSRKQAEKALAQQAQELGRSKDVLELHVQARTQELQKLQRRYEHILNSAGEGIYGLDLQGRTTFVNPAAAKLTGWKVEELVGKSEQEIFYHQPANGDSQTSFVAHNGEHLTDQVFFRKDGTTFPTESVRTPIIEKEKLVGAVVIFKDITERKRTEEALARKAAELARSNAELEQFAYVASHDLQEPLRKIRAFGDRLKSKCEAVKLQEGRDYLERMQSAAARMQTLINDLLTFSRIISTSQPFVPVDLAAVTKEVLTDLEVRIEQTKAKVETGQLPTIEADPLQIRQLLQNLVGNALKFQAPGAQPMIKINARIIKSPFAGGPDSTPNDEVCELVVEDNGIGFEEKYLDKIFGMFQRLHGRSEYEGTGVGLAVCRRITDRHGGMITARSKPGQGASFIATLPVRQQTKEIKAAA